MKTYTTYFDSIKQFTAFVHAHAIEDNDRLLIQVFTALSDIRQIRAIRNVLAALFPHAALIGASTDGEIASGRVSVGKTVVALTQFATTTLSTTLVDGYATSLGLGRQLAQQLPRHDDNRLLITFTDGLHCNGEDYVRGISEVRHGLIIAGGLAGDGARFAQTFVFTRDRFTTRGAAGVLLSNPALQIHTDYNFNWTPIGKFMTVTRVEGNRLYTLDDQPAVAMYARYLGEELAEKLPEIGVEFPLIIQRGDYRIARAILARHDDGSLTSAGNFLPGDRVRFGYGDAEMILNRSFDAYEALSRHPVESIFVYSCMARRRFMPDLIGEEIRPLQSMAEVSGFFTYGEFYSSHGQSMLMNQTTTLLALSESAGSSSHPHFEKTSQAFPIQDYQKSIKALSHLVNVTTKELRTENERLEEWASQLEDKNRTLQNIQEIGHFGSWEINFRTRKSTWSRENYLIYGLDPDTAHLSLRAFYSQLLPEDRILARKTLHEARHGKDVKTIRVHARHTDGRLITLLVNGKILFDKHGKPLSLIGTTLDITEQVQLKAYNDELASIIENSTNEIYVVERGTHRYLYANRAALERLGYTRDELLQLTILDINQSLSLPDVQGIEKRIMEHGTISNRTVHTTKEGATYPVESFIQYHTYQEKEVAVIFDIDITERVAAEQNQKRQAEILEQIRDSVVSTDLNDIITSWNHGAETIHGYTAEEMIGRPIYTLYFEEDIPLLQHMKEETLRQGMFQGEIRKRTKSGEGIDTLLTLTPFRDENGDVIGLTRFTQDITQRKKIEQQLKEQTELLNYQAYHDALTGLPNRTLFDDRLQQAMANAKKHDEMLGLLFIDLDNFKQINDTLGHPIGDRILKVIAKRLQGTIREEDTLARLGGDEFVLLTRALTSPQSASTIANKIIDALRPGIVLDAHELHISASIGVSLYPQDTSDKNDLLKYADTAMYKAKEVGKNAYKFYSEDMTTEAVEKARIEAGLRKAISDRKLPVHYQPQIDARDGHVIGVEALTRWEHPDLGLIGPDQFIPVAEDSHLIVKIDQLTMLHAMEDVKAWYDAGLNPGILSLNLSIKQLMNEHFIQSLFDTIKQTDFKVSWLEFEITESQMMHNPEKSIQVLETLSSFGISVAIDDFGTGYSSLAHLKRLPVKTLKIDRSFIKDLPDDEEDRAISKAIIGLAQSLKLDIIAEGVETEDQVEYLLENGCHFIQGYYYSRPIPRDAMADFLEEYR